jgi:hypothetical protein
MHQIIMPQPIPVLEEDPIKLIIKARIRCTQDNYHIFGAIGGYIESMNGTGPAHDFSIFGGENLKNAVNLDAHPTLFYTKVLVLKWVEVDRRARRMMKSSIDTLVVRVTLINSGF